MPSLVVIGPQIKKKQSGHIVPPAYMVPKDHSLNRVNAPKIQMTGMKPEEAIELKKVPLSENYPLEDTLLEDGLYPYLLQPGEEHDDQRQRAMDRICSKKTCRLKEVVEDSGNLVMYYLSDGAERTLVSEGLFLIPEDTDLPSDYIQKW